MNKIEIEIEIVRLVNLCNFNRTGIKYKNFTLASFSCENQNVLTGSARKWTFFTLLWEISLSQSYNFLPFEMDISGHGYLSIDDKLTLLVILSTLHHVSSIKLH